jgi:hypothetical protein
LVEIVQFSKRQSCPCFGLRALLFCKCYWLIVLPRLYTSNWICKAYFMEKIFCS